MGKNSKNEAAIPNPALKPLSILVGEWTMTGTHPASPDTTFHGHATFEWLEGGAFLIMVSEFEEPGIPSSIAVFGSDDATEVYSMLYFDERVVSRRYEATLQDDIWKLWRNAPGFAQRFTGTFADEGQTITGFWEVAEDGSNWARDLELTYTRVT